MLNCNPSFFLILKLACGIKCVPFNWNQKLSRLEKPTKLGFIRYYTAFGIFSTLKIFVMLRLIQITILEQNSSQIPPRAFIMNCIWAIGLTLQFICKVQCEQKYDEILYFTNALIQHRSDGKFDNVGAEQEEFGMTVADSVQKPTSRSYKDSFVIYATVVVATIMTIVNPLPHSLVILDMPCGTQYLTSIVFPCQWVGDRPMNTISLIPFFILETILLIDVIVVWGFMWSIVFLGLNWIKDEIPAKQGVNSVWIQDDQVHASLAYRRAQLLNILLNNNFSLYLEYFPSLLFVLCGLLTFGTIRLAHLALHTYLVYPACAFRCFFEAVSLHQMAAVCNDLSGKYLLNLARTRNKLMANANTMCIATATYLKVFRKSCWKLSCNASSLYKLEKTIVLVCLSNCAELIFNLLIAFPKAEEHNWGQSQRQ